jgi:hypothetical protein
VSGYQDFREVQGESWCVTATLMPEGNENLRLVQCHPVRYTVRESINNYTGIFGEPV